MLPDPSERSTLNAGEVAAVIGLGVTLVREQGCLYIATDGREGIPCIRYGRLLKFPTAAIRRHLGIDAPIELAAPHPTPPATPGGPTPGGPTTFTERGVLHGSHAPPTRIQPTSQHT